MIPEKYRDKDQYLGLDWYTPNVYNVSALIGTLTIIGLVVIPMFVVVVSWVAYFTGKLMP